MQRVLWLLQVVLLSITCSAALASAADTPPELALTLDQHRFSPEELRVKADTPFILVITNKDKEDEEFEISALRIEQIVSGGKTLQLKMPALKPGTYEFVGEFHEKTAKGRIVAE
jgi:heme/copper-type cytochrome/quinol oxidase subunit 2